MNNTNRLNELKAFISLFITETKSTNILDLVTYVDCKLKLEKSERAAVKRLSNGDILRRR